MKRQEASRATRPVVKPAPTAKRERTKPRDFVKEVVAELKKVAWPTRQEVVAYSIVVVVATVVIAAVIFAMDYVFTKAVLALFGVEV
ncbi:MAG TPA: preprotein translocase subunit SecE [Actinomycetota bacterium]|nr:preprotein translocase subunit SecE [Actinomycetota bacterium]